MRHTCAYVKLITFSIEQLYYVLNIINFEIIFIVSCFSVTKYSVKNKIRPLVGFFSQKVTPVSIICNMLILRLIPYTFNYTDFAADDFDIFYYLIAFN